MSAARIFGSRCRALMAAAKSAVAAAVNTPTVAKAKAGPRINALMRDQSVSPALAKFLGTPEASRSAAIKKIWAYVKEQNLQNPSNNREIICDDKLKVIFDGNDKVIFQNVAKFLSNHFPKATVAKAKTGRAQTVSPALAMVLGTREASWSDAVKKIWAYVKAQNLQNPSNHREIICDDKLKAIFDGNDRVIFQNVVKLLSNHFPKAA